MSRRLLRYLLAGLGLLVLGGLWAFSTFLFNPFEGAWEYDIASLVPREVDFYAAKKDLRNDFDPFPKLAIADEFAASRAGLVIQETATYRRLYAELEVEKNLAALEQSLAELPVKTDPLNIFGGRALAIAGRFKGPELAQADWAVYGRSNRLGKLGFELVDGGWIDLSAQGIQVAEHEKDGDTIGFVLSGGQLQRPLYLTRIQDVVIVATNAELVDAAHALEAARGENSLALSAKYGDNLAREGRSGDELEVYVDQRSLAENLKLPGTWPDPKSNFYGTAIAARLFQVGILRELIGTVDFDEALSVDFVGELSSNVLTPFQQRLYEQRGFDREQMLEVARLVPADAAVFLYAHADIGDLVREAISVVRQIDPAAVENLEDTVRSVWNHPDLDPWIDDLDLAFRDRFAFFIRKHDYPEEPDGPPHDDIPVPAWGLVLWPQDAARLKQLTDTIQQNQTAFGIRGRDPGSTGVIDNTQSGMGGAKVIEYWSPFVPGTGHVATIEMKGREAYFMISNHNRLEGQVFKTYHTGPPHFPRLADQSRFLTWVNAGLPSANVLLWLDPRAISETNRKMAGWQAELDAGGQIDWTVERPRIERKVLAENFPEETYGNVSSKNMEAYERLLQQEIDRFEDEFKSTHASDLRARYERRIDLWEITTGVLLELASDRKRLHLLGRAGFDLAAPAAEL